MKMKIIYYNGFDLPDEGAAFNAMMPEAEVRKWHAGDHEPADYALVWKPPIEMLANRTELKAIFNLGAGVDAMMKMVDQLPTNVPVIRLEDAGMAEQMADYVSSAVLRYYRHLDDYQQQAAHHRWQPKWPDNKKEFTVAVLGLGVLGSVIARRLQQLHFPVLGWSRTKKNLDGVICFSGTNELTTCLAKARVVVCILPLTPETSGILNRTTLSALPKGAYVINVGRGAHVVEEDLLTLLQNAHLAGATLDVFQTEPLPAAHPFWQQHKVTITPHISAQTLLDDAYIQIAEKIKHFEKGLPVTGVIDRSKGY